MIRGCHVLAGRITHPRGASITPDDTRFALAGANIDGALHNYRHGPSYRTVAVFRMHFGSFEQVALRGLFSPGREPASLYAYLSGPEQPPEAILVDSVVRNLRRGRALMMIVGDGIRSKAAILLGCTGSHAEGRSDDHVWQPAFATPAHTDDGASIGGSEG
jgi:hypothetical protein